MAKRKVDKYVNIINISAEESAADTLTFTEINIGTSMLERVGLLIRRIEWFPETALYTAMVAANDLYRVAMTTSNAVGSINPSEASVVVARRLQGWVSGAPASGAIEHEPLVDDYTNLPEGGLLVAPRPLYIGQEGANIGVAITVQVRIYFTMEQLADADYFELLESRRFYG